MANIPRHMHPHSAIPKEVGGDLVAHLKQKGASLDNFDLFDPVLRAKSIAEVLEALEFIQNESRDEQKTGKMEDLYSEAMGSDQYTSLDYAESGEWVPIKELSRKIYKSIPVMRDRTALVCTGTDTILVSRTNLARSDINYSTTRWLYLVQSTVTRDPVEVFVTTEYVGIEPRGGSNLVTHCRIENLANPRDYSIPNIDLCPESKYRTPNVLLSSNQPNLQYKDTDQETLAFILDVIIRSKQSSYSETPCIVKLIRKEGVTGSEEPPRRFKVQSEGYGMRTFSPIPKTKTLEITAIEKAAKIFTNYWQKYKDREAQLQPSQEAA